MKIFLLFVVFCYDFALENSGMLNDKTGNYEGVCGLGLIPYPRVEDKIAYSAS